ncbi:hypothetical protein D3C72_1580760 [compost metagenome]
MPRSCTRLCFHAASAPMGMATATETISVISISENVGTSRWLIMWLTGNPVKSDVPRSPCSTFQPHSPKRWRKGWSSPSVARIRAMSCGVASSPASSAAGSPGARSSRPNTNSATNNMTGSVMSSRRNVYESIDSPCLVPARCGAWP